MKQICFISIITLLLSAADARGAQVPVEVIFALDVSLSMKNNTGTGANSLHCPGSQPLVDLCGDGICSGHELVGNCAADCLSCTQTSPGSCPVCPSGSADASRYAMVKRAMRNLIPSLRTEAKFGLVVFPRQKDYYPYYPADTSSVSTKAVTLYLSKAELFAGGWVDGEGWDTVNDGPVGSFTRHGTVYTLLSLINDSTITVTADSLYRRQVGDLFEEKRFPYGGETLIDGGEQWTYSGSYYNYYQRSRLGQNNGNRNTAPEFRGPQYEDNGVTWIYHRFEVNDDGPIDDVNPYTSELLVPLPTDLQSDRDQALGQLMNYYNRPTHGGLVTAYSTPTRSAVQIAGQHFAAQALNDPWVACRGRFVILLSDGLHYPNVSDHDPVPETQTLFQVDPANPIRTLAVGVPGLPSRGVTELNEVADNGDDGLLNGSATAYIATTEAELISSLKAALALVTGGDSGSVGCLLPCFNGTCPEGQMCVNDQFCQPIPPDGGLVQDAGADSSSLADSGTGDLLVDAGAVDSGSDAGADAGADTGADAGAPGDLGHNDGDGAAAGDGAADTGTPVGDAPGGDLPMADTSVGDGPESGDSAQPDGSGGDAAAAVDSAAQADTVGATDGGPAADLPVSKEGDTRLATGAEGDSGCDCSMGAGAEGLLWVPLLGLLALLRRRRRRR